MANGAAAGARWYDRLLTVDRRWIYLLLGLAAVVPALFPFHVGTSVSGEVRHVHSFVERLEPGDVVHVAIDFDPSSLAELQPMAEAILRQAFGRGARVVVTSLSQFGPAMAEEILTRVAEEAGKQRNVDYTLLGYKPYPGLTILAMGSNYRVPFPRDYYGTAVDSIPMMHDIRNFRNAKGVIALAGGNVGEFWIQYGNAKYGVPLALGVTGVMASDYYPYLQSGQLFGLIPGMKGAAEYEMLVRRRGAGSQGMAYQTTTHLLILVLMVLTNIAFFAQRAARKRAGRIGR